MPTAALPLAAGPPGVEQLAQQLDGPRWRVVPALHRWSPPWRAAGGAGHGGEAKARSTRRANSPRSMREQSSPSCSRLKRCCRRAPGRPTRRPGLFDRRVSAFARASPRSSNCRNRASPRAVAAKPRDGGRNVQVARMRLALLRDLPVGAGGGIITRPPGRARRRGAPWAAPHPVARRRANAGQRGTPTASRRQHPGTTD